MLNTIRYTCTVISLTFNTLWSNSADNNLIFFLIFLRKYRVGYPKQICMKSQTLFFWKKKKKTKNKHKKNKQKKKNKTNISKYCLLKIFPTCLHYLLLLMCLNIGSWVANSDDPDKTQHYGVWSGSFLFVLVWLFKNLRFLWYTPYLHYENLTFLIYLKFYPPKNENFLIKITLVFTFQLKT